MKELITYNYDDYKKMALKLSNDKNYYNDLKSRLLKEDLLVLYLILNNTRKI